MTVRPLLAVGPVPRARRFPHVGVRGKERRDGGAAEPLPAHAAQGARRLAQRHAQRLVLGVQQAGHVAEGVDTRAQHPIHRRQVAVCAWRGPESR